MNSQSSPDARRYPLLVFVVGLCVGAFAMGLVAILAGGVGGMTRPAGPLGRAVDVVHDVTVSYMYETAPGTASGNNSLRVESIRFFPGYVVITQASGSSQVLAVDRLRHFEFIESPAEAAK